MRVISLTTPGQCGKIETPVCFCSDELEARGRAPHGLAPFSQAGGGMRCSPWQLSAGTSWVSESGAIALVAGMQHLWT